MWTSLLAKIIGTAIISITSLALAAWALRVRQRDPARRRQSDPSETKRPKPRRSPLPRFVKWSGVVMCVILGSAWLASMRWSVDYYISFSRPFHTIGLKQGAIAYVNVEHLSFIPDPTVSERRWMVRRSAPNWKARLSFHRNDIVITARIWMLLVFFAAVAGIGWRFERRRPPPGHCPCGYDLTGNVSGTCPECGIEVRQ